MNEEHALREEWSRPLPIIQVGNHRLSLLAVVGGRLHDIGIRRGCPRRKRRVSVKL